MMTRPTRPLQMTSIELGPRYRYEDLADVLLCVRKGRSPIEGPRYRNLQSKLEDCEYRKRVHIQTIIDYSYGVIDAESGFTSNGTGIPGRLRRCQ